MGLGFTAGLLGVLTLPLQTSSRPALTANAPTLGRRTSLWARAVCNCSCWELIQWSRSTGQELQGRGPKGASQRACISVGLAAAAL